jgi:hypothetical protein
MSAYVSILANGSETIPPGHVVVGLAEAQANQAELASLVTSTEGQWGIIAIEYPYSIRGAGYGGDINDETSNGLSSNGNWANGIARVFLKNLTIPTTPNCFRKDSLVKTDQGEIEIQNITNEHTINDLKVIMVTKAFNSDGMLARIEKGAINNLVPTATTYIQKDHKLMLTPLEMSIMKNITWERTPSDEILYNVLLEKPSYMYVNSLKVETVDPNSDVAKYWTAKTEEESAELIKKLEYAAYISNILHS